MPSTWKLLSTLALGLVLASGAGIATASDFEATLDRHIAAIQNRDLAEIEATITGGEELTLIFPDGERLTTRAAFMDFHRDWFASDTWTMHIEKHSIAEGADYGIATVRTRYEDIRDGKPVVGHSWLTLMFRKEGDRWALFYDQNTRIPE